MTAFVIVVKTRSGSFLLKRGLFVQLFDTRAEADAVVRRKHASPNAALLQFEFATEEAVMCTNTKYGACREASEEFGDSPLCPRHRRDVP